VHVLVAEDEVRIAAGLKRSLEDEGYRVDVATSGPDALWYAAEFPYDAVLLDLTLPGLGGAEVCRRLRSARQRMPILLLRSDSTGSQRNGCPGDGADGYVSKPFAFAELTERVRTLIQRGTGERPAELTVGDLTMNVRSHQVWRGRRELDLTGTEFALLRLFMSQAGIVLSRRTILEHIWGYRCDRASNIVDQYVSYLRRKIDRPFHLIQLVTVRGRGYQLRLESIPE
jgi:two-component system OmpR family response regulator